MSTLIPEGDRLVRLLLLAGALVALGLLGSVSTIVVVLSFVFMLAFHELGHYLAARWTGMQVTEFFIGFGPRLWSVHRGETEYGIKAIPAGAYVRITGMTNLETVPPDLEHRTYRAQSYPRRMAVAVAGSATHFLVAVVLLAMLFGAVGRPDPTEWTVSEVVAGSTADEIGVLPGDRILSVAGVETTGFDSFGRVVRVVPSHTVEIVVERNGVRSEHSVVMGERPTPVGTMEGFFWYRCRIPDEAGWSG